MQVEAYADGSLYRWKPMQMEKSLRRMKVSIRLVVELLAEITPLVEGMEQRFFHSKGLGTTQGAPLLYRGASPNPAMAGTP